MSWLAWASGLEVLHRDDGTAVLVGDQAVLLTVTAGQVVELVGRDGTTREALEGAVAGRFGEEALTPVSGVRPLDALVAELVGGGILVWRADPDQ